MRLSAIAIAVITLAGAAAVTAQEAAPELERTYFRTAAGPRSLARYADCLINRHPQEARALFEHDPGSSGYNQAQAQLFDNSSTCLFSNRSLSWSGVMMMGTLAENLIRDDSVERPTGRMLRAEFTGGGTYRWQWQGLSQENEWRLLPLAECLLTRHGEQVSAVLGERANAEGERKAFNAMSAEISDCIPRGEQRALQPQQLRAALAATYYRAARAASSSRAPA
jgi:hypothetical protein